MSDRMSLEQIREFWTTQAKEHGQAAAASWTDVPVMNLEVQAIARRLTAGDEVLDIGCANGYSTVQLAGLRDVKILGMDYIPEMIQQAKSRLAGLAEPLRRSVKFDVGDITNISAATGTYDKVVVIRVVINLENRELQVRALKECARVLKPGGLLLLSEATVNGWKRMNALRAECDLGPIPMPSFNLYLEEEDVIAAVRPELELVEIDNFASTYFVGSRVFKPLLAKLVPSIDVANPMAELNRFFSQAPAWGDYGTQKLFVFRKV